jgi:flagellar motor protein MotB
MSETKDEVKDVQPQEAQEKPQEEAQEQPQEAQEKPQEEAQEQPQEAQEKPQEEAQEQPQEATQVTKKDLRLSGEAESAVNEQAMSELKKAASGEPSQSDEPQVTYASFFVDKEKTYKIEVDILFDQKSGQILSVSKVGLILDFSEFEYLNHTKEWFEFTQPTYDQMSNYRQRSQVYHRETNRMVVDGVRMRSFFLTWHLKDWSLKDGNGNKIELKVDEDGSLSTDSFDMVFSLQPTLVDVVMTLFEKDILLS